MPTALLPCGGQRSLAYAAQRFLPSRLRVFAAWLAWVGGPRLALGVFVWFGERVAEAAHLGERLRAWLRPIASNISRKCVALHLAPCAEAGRWRSRSCSHRQRVCLHFRCGCVRATAPHIITTKSAGLLVRGHVGDMRRRCDSGSRRLMFILRETHLSAMCACSCELVCSCCGCSRVCAIPVLSLLAYTAFVRHHGSVRSGPSHHMEEDRQDCGW